MFRRCNVLPAGLVDSDCLQLPRGVFNLGPCLSARHRKASLTAFSPFADSIRSCNWTIWLPIVRSGSARRVSADHPGGRMSRSAHCRAGDSDRGCASGVVLWLIYPFQVTGRWWATRIMDRRHGHNVMSSVHCRRLFLVCAAMLTIASHSVVARGDDAMDRECRAKTVFVCPSEEEFLPRILSDLWNRGTLTVGDIPQFLEGRRHGQPVGPGTEGSVRDRSGGGPRQAGDSVQSVAAGGQDHRARSTGVAEEEG